MEFLKEYLGEELYAKLAEKLTGNDKVKLANLASGEYVAKAKFEAAEKQAEEIRKQIAERDGQLAELKKGAGDNAELTKQIKALQDANAAAEQEMKKRLTETARDYALKDALKNDFKARDVLSVLPHLKQDAIVYADGKITGLKEQVEALQKEKAFLFGSESEPVPPGTGGAPGVTPPPAGTDFASTFNFQEIRKTN